MGLMSWIKDEDEENKSSEDEFYSVSESDALKEADKVGNKMILLEPRAFSEALKIMTSVETKVSQKVFTLKITFKI